LAIEEGIHLADLDEDIAVTEPSGSDWIERSTKEKGFRC
jgi:hypothetical protein